METTGRRELIARGASAIPAEKLALLAQMHGKAVRATDQCDSGFCDDDDESRSRSMEYESELQKDNTKEVRSLEESTQNLSIGDPRSDNRQPSCPHGPNTQKEPEDSTTGDHFLGYAQCNDPRYLLTQDHIRQQLFFPDEDGDTALHLAIINMKPLETDAIISVAPFKQHLDISNHLRQTALHLATITRQPFVIRRLLEVGACPDIPDRNGKTCLHLACERGDLDCVKEITKPLLDKRWSEEIKDRVYHMLDERDYDGFSALHLAVSVSSPQIVEYLVSLGANVDGRDGKSGRSSLHHAVEAGDLLMINALFQCSADVDAMTYDECTPLHIAAGRGMESVVALLLALGADPELTTYEGESAQLLASTAEICEMLTG